MIQSFEEAAQAVELVQPSAFVFDGGVFSSWALRLMESDRFPSIGLYLLLDDPCRIGHAAADCKVLPCWTKKTLSLFFFGLMEQCGPYKRLCTHLVVLAFFTHGYFCLGYIGSVESTDHIMRRATATMEPVSAPADVALICFTSGKSGSLLK